MSMKAPSPGLRTTSALMPMSLMLCCFTTPLAQAEGGSTPPAIVAQCAACHGSQGISPAPATPHLAGQLESYLVEQLKNYRSGKRPHVIMGVMAQPLSDEQINEAARWYANVKIEIKKE